MSQQIVCIVGPTASGKTALSLELAKQLNAEILSADSMQVYRGMDIGTGKVPIEERCVPHHGLDLVDPGEEYSASLFQTYGRKVLRSLKEQDKSCVICGGTGFYIRALLDNLDFPQGEQLNNSVRDFYQNLYEKQGPQAVWQALEAKDPRSAACIHPNNTRRVIRALEMFEFDGISYADQKERFQDIPEYIPAKYFGLSVEKEILNQRIDKRVDKMIEDGLVDEVKLLLSSGYRDGITASQAIGYKEIVAALEGTCSMDEAIEQIKIASHRYAKRQRSWFKRDNRITWLDGSLNTEELTNQILRKLQ